MRSEASCGALAAAWTDGRAVAGYRS